jgi:hypothetical protein
MNGGGRLVDLIVAMDEVWRTAGGGGKNCSVNRTMLRARFICPGWCKAGNHRIKVADGDGASIQC